MSQALPVNPPFTVQPPSKITILTGNDWAPWFEWAVHHATSSLLLSIYMISGHWRDPTVGKLDLVRTLAQAAERGVQCRGIVDQPNVQGRKEPFNIRAAKSLEASGWKLRKVPDARTLHEKILVIDNAVCAVGSHNISKASATSNYDTTLVIESPDLAEMLRIQFWRRWRIAVPLDRVA